MEKAKVDSQFWYGKKVFLTGHTGFKGGWLSLWLSSMGAIVTGYSLAPNTRPNLYDILKIGPLIKKSHIANIQDLAFLQKAMTEAKPEILIHMAAQPLVRYSYANPVETYATNVMGTVHVLDSVRSIDSVRATVVVTSDKCYENKDRARGYRENEPMGGYDPYSNSKGCAELVTSAYRQSYFSDKSQNQVASARAGNVIGGGDWSDDRLVPDVIKAFEASKPLMIRNPLSIRPWQHVLEPLAGYLVLAQALHEKGAVFASAWNFGPCDEDNCTVQELVELMISGWGHSSGWKKEGSEQPHESRLLKLDCTKAREQLRWAPKWNLSDAVQKIIEWHHAFSINEDMQKKSLLQIKQYMSY